MNNLFGEDVEIDVNDDPLLYEDAEITKWESLLSVLNLYYRHKMPKVLLLNILKLVSLHIPSPNLASKTIYKFFKNFGSSIFNMKKHYYCVHCLRPLRDGMAECPRCDDLESSYFLDISLTEQLRELYERPGFVDLLNQRFQRQSNEGEYSDIYDGTIYQELSSNDGILSDPRNISFTWYTDGVKIFKKSKYEIWPIYLVINELPYSERMKISNLLLVSLWFGEKKPNIQYVLDILHENLGEVSVGVDFRY